LPKRQQLMTKVAAWRVHIAY